MRIAVFLDVDKTLTVDFIQKQYAEALNCEPAYSALEKQYQAKTITSKTFGDKLIELFAEKGFTRAESNGHFDDIKLKPDAKELLELQMQPGLVKADVYLVSSGPNYYIDALAARYNIKQGNFCRSVYKFKNGAGLIESCVAIDDQDKADFVSKKKEEGKYDITIGVGDSAGLDGAFLSQCTVRLMTEETGTYLHIPKLTSLLQLIERLSKIGQEELTEETLVALIKEKCEQSPKLIQDLQKLYPCGPSDGAPGRAYPVLPVALMAIALGVVVLSGLSCAHQLPRAIPAIVAVLSLVASGLLLISYWKPSGRIAAFWWVAGFCFVGQMGLVVPIFRDAFFDEAHHWVNHDLFWGLIVTIVVLLAAPAVAEPVRKLTGNPATSGAPQETI